MEEILLDHLNKVTDALVGSAFAVGPVKPINFGLQFSVTKGGTSGVLRIYYSKKKGVNPDLSQLESCDFFPEVATIMASLGYQPPVKILPVQSSLPDVQDVPFPVIGTDESGKGDFFGPLVVSAVYVTKQLAGVLEALGVKDSKTISDAKILELALDLETMLRNMYVVIEISPKRYNELYSKFKSEQQTLNSLLGWGHAKAIEELLVKVDCSVVIVDKFGNEKFVEDKLQEKGKQVQVIQKHKAEANIAVAAASILARARFLTKLGRLSAQHGIVLPKGAGDNVKAAAKKILALRGASGLEEVAKMHFKMGL